MLEVLLILGGLALTLVLVIALSMLMFLAYTRVRRKGYTPPAAAAVLAAGLSFGVAASVCWVAMNPAQLSNLELFLKVFYVPMIAAAGATTLAMLSLPTRGARTFGERRPGFPFERVGQAVIGLGVAAGGVAVAAALTHRLDAGQLDRALVFVATFVIPGGLYFVHLAARTRAPAQPAVLARDARAAVLYLRAFNQESQFFLIGAKRKYGAWASGFGAVLAKPEQNVGVTFEGFFASALTRAVGPFVALGSPEDYLAPEGAARQYAKDTEWMQRLEELAKGAVCIVLEVGQSANLRWELEYLRSTGQQSKLYVFTHPDPEPGTRLAYAYWGLLWRLKGIRKIGWPGFAAGLAALGYLPGDDPGPGAVLTFDAEGRGLLLTREAASPDEFIAPIVAWIERQERIGKCMPTSCHGCGRRVYVVPAESTAAARALCQGCAGKLAAAARSPRERWFDAAIRWCFWWFVVALLAPIAVAAFLPSTPWLDEWSGWFITAAFLALLALPVAIGLLLPDRKPIGSFAGPVAVAPPPPPSKRARRKH